MLKVEQNQRTFILPPIHFSKVKARMQDSPVQKEDEQDNLKWKKQN